jgi:HPt (histidine-containing phosphotransfer) domain-containing protein
MSERPVLDRSVLAALVDAVDGDRGFVVDLVETYLVDAEHQLDELETAAGAGDAAATVRPAHTLKSSSATVGAMAVAELARESEAAGREGVLDATRSDALRAALGAAAAELRDWMQGGDAS